MHDPEAVLPATVFGAREHVVGGPQLSQPSAYHKGQVSFQCGTVSMLPDLAIQKIPGLAGI